MKTCKYCKKSVTGTHYCGAVGRTVAYDDGSSFVLLAAIGYITNNALIGGLAGGSIAGGIAGDLLNGGAIGDSGHDSGVPDNSATSDAGGRD